MRECQTIELLPSAPTEGTHMTLCFFFIARIFVLHAVHVHACHTMYFTHTPYILQS